MTIIFVSFVSDSDIPNKFWCLCAIQLDVMYKVGGFQYVLSCV